MTYGGFRIGELAALRLDDVDWERSTIRVDEAVTDVNGHLEYEEPKSDRAFRTVPIADLPLEKLRSHIESRIGWDDSASLLFPWSGRRDLPAVQLEKTPLGAGCDRRPPGAAHAA